MSPLKVKDGKATVPPPTFILPNVTESSVELNVNPESLDIDDVPFQNDTLPDVPVPVTVPVLEVLLLNVVQSVDVKNPLTDVVAAGIETTGVVPPDETTGDVAVTDVIVPVLEVLLLNVDQSVPVKAPVVEALEVAIEIAGELPPEDAIGDVPVTPVTVPVLDVLLLKVVKFAAVK